MATRKPDPGKQPSKKAKPVPSLAEKPVHKTSQADQAHIATAGYRRDQRAAVDRIAKLKAARLAQEATAGEPMPKAKKPKAPAGSERPKGRPLGRPLDRTRPPRSRRWGG